MFHGSNIHVEGQLLSMGRRKIQFKLGHNSIENNRWGQFVLLML